MMYVTLERAKAHLGMDHDEDDTLISAYISAASGAVKNYLKSASAYEVERDSNDDPVLDSNGDPVYARDSNGAKEVRLEVQQGVLLLIGYFYKNRDENPDNAFAQGYLPAPVTALLYPLRDPALA
ncbi:TPA: phage gp6-like head-tail connector protein [Pseudomonas aeruginosa]|uniref:head-tail connector protein n=1 Tax=Pseudomonas aeruginosa TaxID=287 RepID=UPI0012DAA888|nr:head-tail connector protein [Pseudomonas aeruginosa]MUH87338.1 phage gp6-like head-tail connector protein [Pseudomonas aeruginosa]HBO3004323.1 phage gp6-like head-tail connector protein [Pseudomonas aeruginosa]HBO4694680.1 phage gp6-like head-tail connector protein [Pseudomonas aeruginosa]